MANNNNKTLSIQVSLNGLSFSILNQTLNTVELLKTLNFEQNLIPFDVLNRLKAELNSNTAFSENFDSVIVIHQNELSTLVPKSLFDEKDKANYLKFNSKILTTDFITHDAILVNNSINVYVPYVNINNYIFGIFGEFTYKHSSSILIQTILQKQASKETTTVFINVNTNAIEFLVTDKGCLQLFNVFNYNSKEDFIYYILFAFEQLQLNVETVTLQLSGKINVDDALFNILYAYVRHIEIIKFDLGFKYSDTIDTNTLHHHYLILNSI